MRLSQYFTAADGTRLHFRDSGDTGSRTPLLCLAGLTRHSRDFDPVFDMLAGQRRVIALDFRGRGLSDKAVDSATYTPVHEKDDTLALLAHLDLARVAILGTSRGGIVGMLMGGLHPQKVAGLMFNDIGPDIEPASLERIRGFVGEDRVFASWDAAATALGGSALGFHNVSHGQWLVVAQRIFIERGGRPATSHDTRLIDTFPTDASQVADLWPVFKMIPPMPLALLRGTGSDLLGLATANKMQQARPDLLWTEIPDRGHVPFLDEALSITAMKAWLALC